MSLTWALLLRVSIKQAVKWYSIIEKHAEHRRRLVNGTHNEYALGGRQGPSRGRM